MPHQGWIQLHRKIMESETFERLNAIQKLIAIYILLNANHADNVWHDKYKKVSVVVKRGQLVLSRKTIVEDWFNNDPLVTEQKVRTTLNKLCKLHFLTKTSTKLYTVITVVKYDDYQNTQDEVNQDINQALTKHQPSTNQALTTNNNDNNVNNDNNDKKRNIYCQNSNEFRLASYLFKWIKQNNPKAKEPNLQKWSKTFDLMMRIDKRSLEEIKQVIQWCQKDTFWYKNILSADKLRKQYDRLLLLMQDSKPKPKINNSIPDNVQSGLDLVEQIRREEAENARKRNE